MSSNTDLLVIRSLFSDTTTRCQLKASSASIFKSKRLQDSSSKSCNKWEFHLNSCQSTRTRATSRCHLMAMAFRSSQVGGLISKFKTDPSPFGPLTTCTMPTLLPIIRATWVLRLWWSTQGNWTTTWTKTLWRRQSSSSQLRRRRYLRRAGSSWARSTPNSQKKTSWRSRRVYGETTRCW